MRRQAREARRQECRTGLQPRLADARLAALRRSGEGLSPRARTEAGVRRSGTQPRPRVEVARPRRGSPRSASTARWPPSPRWHRSRLATAFGEPRLACATRGPADGRCAASRSRPANRHSSHGVASPHGGGRQLSVRAMGAPPANRGPADSCAPLTVAAGKSVCGGGGR